MMKGRSDSASEGLSGDTSRPGPSDEELMTRYQKGEVEALNELIVRHGRPLYGFLDRLTGSRERAQDAYQEVFLRVVRSAKSYQPSARFAAWLYTIARNHCVDLSRRARFRNTESLDDPISDDTETTRLDMVADDGPDPEANLRGAELSEALEAAVAALPGEQREVFLLRERAGLSFKEIAAVQKAPLNTVKTRMHYALNALRQALAGQGFWGEEA